MYKSLAIIILLLSVYLGLDAAEQKLNSSKKPEIIVSGQYTLEDFKNTPIYKYKKSNAEMGHYVTLLELLNFPMQQEIICSYSRLAYKGGKEFKILDTFKIPLANSNGYPFVVDSKGILPGEKMTFRYETKNHKLKKEICINPHPLENKNSDGSLSVKAELRLISPAFFRLCITGLAENEKFKLISNSESEFGEKEMIFNTNNLYTYSPDVIETKGGVATIIIRSETGKEVSLNIPWGTELIRQAID